MKSEDLAPVYRMDHYRRCGGSCNPHLREDAAPGQEE